MNTLELLSLLAIANFPILIVFHFIAKYRAKHQMEDGICPHCFNEEFIIVLEAEADEEQLYCLNCYNKV